LADIVHYKYTFTYLLTYLLIIGLFGLISALYLPRDKNSKHMRLPCYRLSVVSHSDLLSCSECKFVSEIRCIARFPCDRTAFLFNFAITQGKRCWPLRQLFDTVVHHVKLDRIVTYSSHSVGRRRVCRRTFLTFLARHHYNAYCGALYAIARPSVYTSHGWISQKQLKLYDYEIFTIR